MKLEINRYDGSNCSVRVFGHEMLMIQLNPSTKIVTLCPDLPSLLCHKQSFINYIIISCASKWCNVVFINECICINYLD